MYIYVFSSQGSYKTYPETTEYRSIETLPLDLGSIFRTFILPEVAEKDNVISFSACTYLRRSTDIVAPPFNLISHSTIFRRRFHYNRESFFIVL